MPVYSFFCSNDHESEWIGSQASRPKWIPCTTCTSTSSPRITRSKKHKGFESMGYNRDNRGLSIHDFHCDSCDESFDQIVDARDGQSTSNIECIKCGEVARWVPASKIDRDSERYPRFDRGLGVMLQSKAHRLDVCANPAKYGIKTKSGKLTPVEGDWDADGYANERKRNEDKDLDGYAEYVEKLDNHPAFKDYRRARDQGRI